MADASTLLLPPPANRRMKNALDGADFVRECMCFKRSRCAKASRRERMTAAADEEMPLELTEPDPAKPLPPLLLLLPKRTLLVPCCDVALFAPLLVLLSPLLLAVSSANCLLPASNLVSILAAARFASLEADSSCQAEEKEEETSKPRPRPSTEDQPSRGGKGCPAAVKRSWGSLVASPPTAATAGAAAAAVVVEAAAVCFFARAISFPHMSPVKTLAFSNPSTLWPGFIPPGMLALRHPSTCDALCTSHRVLEERFGRGKLQRAKEGKMSMEAGGSGVRYSSAKAELWASEVVRARLRRRREARAASRARESAAA